MGNRQTLELIRRAMKRRKYLLGISDVLGYAVGFRQRRGKVTDEPALVVYVKKGRKKKNKADFERHQQIPDRVRIQIRGEMIWLPIDIIESDIGEIQASVQAGISTGNQLLLENSGTIGWVCRDGSNGAGLICGSFHVFIRLPSHSSDPDIRYDALIDPPEFITAPSPEDGGHPANDVVARVVRGRRNQLIDAAVAVPIVGVQLVPGVSGIGAFGAHRLISSSDLGPGSAPLQVCFRGRNTFIPPNNPARVLQYPAVFPFRYPDLPKPVLMFDLIATDIRTESGDSGGALLDLERRPLGVLLGRGGDCSFFIHMRNIIRSLKVIDY